MGKNRMGSDRRIPEGAGSKVSFVFEAVTYEGRIEAVTERALRVVFANGDGPQVMRGATLTECRVHLRGIFADVPFGDLSVEDTDCVHDELVLHLSGEDAAVRARLAFAREALAELEGRPSMERPSELFPPPPPVLPRLPGRGIATEEARRERLAFASAMTGVPLDHMEETSLSAERLAKNIEGLIGGVEIPVGLAGPLLFRSFGLVLAPFATTEGALVASTTRGALALSRAGGVTTRVLHQQMVRAPLFVFRDVGHAATFGQWIRTHVEVLSKEVRKVSKHANLLGVEPYVLGRTVHVIFRYTTGDAAGQNMTTAATWQACTWVLEEIRHVESFELEHFSVEGNMAGDKKFSFLSFLRGRGFRVAADCYVPRAVLHEVLKVSPEAAVQAHEHYMSGSFQAGLVSHNINTSNAVAAIFAATGQDIACVHESSGGLLSLQLADGGLYASMLLPNLVVGTVGGGTHLPRQREMLQLMGCLGDGGAARLAEIIAGFCLALDLSTLSASLSERFVMAHERLGRNKPMAWLAREDLARPSFFDGAAKRMRGDAAVVASAEPLEGVIEPRIAPALRARGVTKLMGLLPYRLRIDVPGAPSSEHDVMVKVKALSEDRVLAMKGASGAQFAKAYARFAAHTGVEACESRELGVCAQTEPRLTRHMPAIYDAYRDPSRGAFVLVMEYLRDVEWLDASQWERAHVEAALDAAASIHSVWYGRERELLEQPWLGVPPSSERMLEAMPLWLALAEYLPSDLASDLVEARDAITSLGEWWPVFEQQPRTLIHNAFNPANLGFAGKTLVIACDWELATLHVPQRDLAELLVHTLPMQRAEPDREEVAHYVEYHRRALERATGRAIDESMWRAGFSASLRELAIHRIPLAIMAYGDSPPPSMHRIVAALRSLLRLSSSGALWLK
ncbi:phosphotransferase [Pendulispora rubella]|uniref:hydroxymethylglutaryl-CoA reductase (NADPH) n=1 Tax=Pendulispora rubella TaxID=2741070 RepID=A0ABZ2LFJ4_9BACT